MSAVCAAAPSPRTVLRPKTRERVRTCPNFRDHRKSVDAPLLRILCRLQARHGWSYVAEAGLRKMICEDTGHMPGVDTVRRALDRLARQGLLHQVWLLKGGVMPDGDVASAGVRLIRVALSRAERSSFLSRSRTQRHRETTTGRVNHRAMFELMTTKRTVAPAPVHPLGQAGQARAFEQERQRQLSELAKLPPGYFD